MSRESAGLLMYRRRGGVLEFLLVHPGGPFWKNKDDGAWTIPKGEVLPGEETVAAARREFQEELGIPAGNELAELTPVKQKSGKLVRAWAFEGDCDPEACRSNTFSLEWPPRSGKMQDFPEVDRVSFFRMEEAIQKLNPAQVPLLRELAAKVPV